MRRIDERQERRTVAQIGSAECINAMGAVRVQLGMSSQLVGGERLELPTLSV
jgi:hypothetical protein